MAARFAPSAGAGDLSGVVVEWKWTGAAVAASMSVGASAADLSEMESRWLQGAWPVVAFAKEARLPLDIVVQPQPSAGQAPLGLAFVDGRCKLVLSMRGNPEAQGTLERIEPGLLGPALELMAAHELGHCRRYLDGAWMGLPVGFTATEPEGLSPGMREAYLKMKAVRREEGYGDLVGLAWTWQHHPEAYTKLLAWLNAERRHDLIPGSHHDTLAWLRLAEQGSALSGPTIFAGAATLWQAGLDADE